MQQPMHTGAKTLSTPSFHLVDRQPLRPGAVLAAIVVAVGALYSVSFALGRTAQAHRTFDNSGSAAASNTPGAAPNPDEKDDPDQVDTIVLGDAADAPQPARRGDHVSNVHATILIHLPRFGTQVGLIPDSSAGHLLYGWLAAFNQASYPALQQILPNVALASSTAAQMNLRQQTGGFNLLSAREIQPGILVFRLRDQTPSANEVLGTLQVRPNASPAAIATFSLRAIPSTHPNANPDAPSTAASLQ